MTMTKHKEKYEKKLLMLLKSSFLLKDVKNNVYGDEIFP